MGTIDSQGIYKYASNDVVAPLETALNVGQQSVSDALAALGPGTTRYVANTAARNALAVSYAPTATKPLYVYRGDATPGRNLEFTLNGTTWDVIEDSRYTTDIGWTSVPLASGYTAANPVSVARFNGTIYWRGRISGSFPANTQVSVSTSVPSWAAPPSFADSVSPVVTSEGIVAYAMVSSNLLAIRCPVTQTSFFVQNLSGYRA